MDINKVNAKDKNINLHNKLYTICSQLKKEDKKHLTTLHMTWISDFKVHTRSNLSVKGIVPDATFVVCGRAVEDATHVLLRAPGSSGNSSALAWLIVMPLTTTTLHRLRLPPAHAPGVQHLRASLLLAFVETEKCCVQQGSPPLSTPSVVRRWLPNRRLDSPPPFLSMCLSVICILLPLPSLCICQCLKYASKALRRLQP
jgi:hypothetical protein